MSIEEKIRSRLSSLVAESTTLQKGNEHDQCFSNSHVAQCSAWLTSAQNCVHLVFSDPNNAYRKMTDRIADRPRHLGTHSFVAELSATLQALIVDAEAGLLVSVANQSRAETFDNFLDHAVAYLKCKKAKESGVIAGVVFEDTLRQVCRKNSIPEKDEKLDKLITNLVTCGQFTDVKAKRARAAADVRTKATHAQWDDFDLGDVDATIKFTRELITEKMDSN